MYRRRFLTSTSLLVFGCIHDEEPPSDDAGDADGDTDGETDEDAESDVEAAKSELYERLTGGSSVVDTGDGYTVAGATSGSLYEAAVSPSPSEDGYPVLETACASDEREEPPDVDEVAPYDGVGESDDGEHLYAAPTAAHDLTPDDHDTPDVETAGERTRATVLEDQKVPEDGFQGEYVLYPEDGEFRRGVYIFVEDESGEGNGSSDELPVSVWPTDHPGPEDESNFASGGLPELTEGRSVAAVVFDDTEWYHEADASTEIYTEPSNEAIEPPESIEFTTRVHVDEVLMGGPGWYLYRLVDGEWTEVTYYHVTLDTLRRIFPWTPDSTELILHHDEPDVDADEDQRLLDGALYSTDAGVHVGYLGGGTYAFYPNCGGRVDEPVPETTEEGPYDVDIGELSQTAYAAAFTVDAPEIEVTTPEDATVERDGDRVRVTTPDAEAAFEVTATEENGRELIAPEALYHHEAGLRYALPQFSEDVEAVEVETDAYTRSRALSTPSDADVRTIEYEGETYEVRGIEE